MKYFNIDDADNVSRKQLQKSNHEIISEKIYMK